MISLSIYGALGQKSDRLTDQIFHRLDALSFASQMFLLCGLFTQWMNFGSSTGLLKHCPCNEYSLVFSTHASRADFWLAPLVKKTQKTVFSSPIRAFRGEGRLTAKFSVTSRPWSFLCAQSCVHRREPPDPLRLRPPSSGALQFKGPQTFLPQRSKGRARALQVERRKRERLCSSLSLPLYWTLWGSFTLEDGEVETFCCWGND